MIVLDASLLVAYRHMGDAHHAAAEPLMDAIASGRHGEAVVLDHVVAEMLTVLMARAGMAAARHAARAFGAPGLVIQPAWPYFEAAMQRFARQKRRGLSVVDCMIVEFAIANRAAVATFDRQIASVDGIEALP